MDLNSYQTAALSTAVYPNQGVNFTYPALGLVGEAGEVAGKVKKMIRDGAMDTAGMVHEVGDVLWYCARLADALGFTLEDVMRINYAKLMKRKNENVLFEYNQQSRASKRITAPFVGKHMMDCDDLGPG